MRNSMNVFKVNKEKKILQHKKKGEQEWLDLGVSSTEITNIKERLDALEQIKEETLPLYKEYTLNWVSRNASEELVFSLIREAGQTLPTTISLLDITTHKLEWKIRNILRATERAVGNRYKYLTDTFDLLYHVGGDKIGYPMKDNYYEGMSLIPSVVSYPYSKEVRISLNLSGIAIFSSVDLIQMQRSSIDYNYASGYYDPRVQGYAFVNPDAPLVDNEVYDREGIVNISVGNLTTTLTPNLTVKTVTSEGDEAMNNNPATLMPAFVSHRSVRRNTTVDTSSMLSGEYRDYILGKSSSYISPTNMPVFAFVKRGRWITGEFKPSFLVGVFEGDITDIKKRIMEEQLEVRQFIAQDVEKAFFAPYFGPEWESKKTDIEEHLRDKHYQQAYTTISHNGSQYQLDNVEHLYTKEKSDGNSAWHFVVISDVKIELSEMKRILEDEVGYLGWTDKVRTQSMDESVGTHEPNFHDLGPVTHELIDDYVDTLFGYGPRQYIYYSACPTPETDSDVTYSRVAVHSGDFEQFKQRERY